MKVGIGAYDRHIMANVSGSSRCANTFATHVNMFGRFLLWMILLGLLIPAEAAFLANFTNCMAESIQKTSPIQLQLVPEAVWVVFNTSASNNLNITVYGNVIGQRDDTPLPPWNSSEWNNVNFTNGKIIDGDPSQAVDGRYLESTLTSTISVLSWTPYSSVLKLCDTTNRQCPIGPVFNSTSLNDLPTFSISTNMSSSYGFTSMHAYLHSVDNRSPPFPLACIIADITPYIGQVASDCLTYLPLATLVFVAIATTMAACFSPWGSWNLFRSTINYGRDADLLRLITPGFGDCLQYIQFIFLSGALTLDYPGYFQPVTASVGWSSLVFNQSFVSHNVTANSLGPTGLVDGIYITNGTRGIETMSQIIGLVNDRNLWAGMIIWLLIILAAILGIIQLGFLGRWITYRVSNTREEDLRAKNFPMSAGNVIRIVFNYFLLPLVTFSMYELLIAGMAIQELSSTVPVAFAAITIVLLIASIVWFMMFIVRTQPRSNLFDEFPIVLLYGPLYNTFSDHQATFAAIPLVLNVLRGIAIGALQVSGIAQLVVLIFCEIVLLVALNYARPFASQTMMNVYHTLFSSIRLIILLLMVTFIPSLNVDDSPRGWIGYVILVLHAIVLGVGFFIHSLGTLVEVSLRLCGFGDDQGTAQRGGLKVFGVRQLSRRRQVPRGGRSSMASNARMLSANEENTPRYSTARSRSMSASSNLLLARGATGDRRSVAVESAMGGPLSYTGSATPHTPTMTGMPTTPYSYLPTSGHPNNAGNRTSGIVNLRAAEAADPFFRPPRPRKNTAELQSPGTTHSHGSMSSGDWQKITADDPESPDLFDDRGGWISPLPAHLGNQRERSGSNPDEGPRPKTDYATREVDYYYGVRGPALSHAPTRRLKTGPADPTGPVSSATGWFKGLFGSKTKEKGKGFEVVRSSRMPPPRASEDADIALQEQEPYQDNPEGVAVMPSKRRTLSLEDEGDAVGGGTRHLPPVRRGSVSSEDEGAVDDGEVSDDEHRVSRITPEPPVLDVEIGDEFKVPSRFGSKASNRPSRHNTTKSRDLAPSLPRKSSRRTPSNGSPADFNRLSTIPQSPASNSKHNSLIPEAAALQRIPFGSGDGSNAQHNRNLSAKIGESGATGLTTSSHIPEAATEEMPSIVASERPSSLGFVQQHRASDGVHVVAGNIPTGSTAELVDEPPSHSEGHIQYPNF